MRQWNFTFPVQTSAHLLVQAIAQPFCVLLTSLSLRLACDATGSGEWSSTSLTSAPPFSFAAAALDTLWWRLDLEARQSSDTSARRGWAVMFSLLRPPADCALTSTPFLCLFSADTHTEVRNQGGRHVCKKLTKLKKWNFSTVVFVGSQRDVHIYNFTMGQWKMGNGKGSKWSCVRI